MAQTDMHVSKVMTSLIIIPSQHMEEARAYKKKIMYIVYVPVGYGGGEMLSIP